MRRNEEGRYVAIKPVPHTLKTVDKKEADIVLTSKKDMTDYVTLGFFCLNNSRNGINETEIKVAYSDCYGNSRSRMFMGRRSYNIRRNAIGRYLSEEIFPVMFYIYGGKSAVDEVKVRVITKMLYPEFTAFVDGEYPGYDKFLGLEGFGSFVYMSDTMRAQKLAYQLACRCLDRLYS